MAERSTYSFSTGDIAVDAATGNYSQPSNAAAAIGAIGATIATGGSATLGSLAITGSFFLD